MASQIKGLTDCDETYEAAVSTNAIPTLRRSDTSAPPRLQLIVCCRSNTSAPPRLRLIVCCGSILQAPVWKLLVRILEKQGDLAGVFEEPATDEQCGLVRDH